VLSNHLHIVLRNRPDIVQSWSDVEVARRWWNVFPKRRDDAGNATEPTDFELQMIMFDPAKMAEIRLRLSSVNCGKTSAARFRPTWRRSWSGCTSATRAGCN
jgi:hypothetical protein